MGEFIVWILVLLFFTAGSIISGYKTKEAWDKWCQVSKPSQTVVFRQNISGDFVNGDKNIVNIPKADEHVLDASKINVAKLKINRAIEDFNKAVDEVATNFPKESNKLAGNFNSRNMLTSGVFIRAQMDLSLNTKKNLDREIEALNRQVEDILVDVLGKTSLNTAGLEFEAEQKLVDEAPKRCLALYPLLNDNPKSWEMKALRENALTKNFDVTNDHSN